MLSIRAPQRPEWLSERMLTHELLAPLVPFSLIFFLSLLSAHCSLLLGIHEPHGKSIAGTENPMAMRMRSESTTRDTLSSEDLVTRKVDEAGRDVPFFQRDSGGMRAIDSTDTYYVGVIDILIQFGAKKKMEHKWKAVRTPSKNARGEHGISVVPPEEYASRFINFMDVIID